MKRMARSGVGYPTRSHKWLVTVGIRKRYKCKGFAAGGSMAGLKGLKLWRTGEFARFHRRHGLASISTIGSSNSRKMRLGGFGSHSSGSVAHGMIG
jgi:hypothetical protein